MKKFLKIMNVSISVFFTIFFAIVCVDWYLGGGCSVMTHGHYEPAFFAPVWKITSLIYSWAPDRTILRTCFWFIATVFTLALPVVLAYYFWIVSREQIKKLRGER